MAGQSYAGPVVLQASPGERPLHELSQKERKENFETAWKAIRETFYDPHMNGVDWDQVHARYAPLIQDGGDQDFYDLLERMAAELHDAHTRVLSPEQALNFNQHQRPSLGVTFQDVEGEIVVIAVAPESAAARAGVAPGMLVKAVDGIPIEEKRKEIAARVAESSSERATRLVRAATIFRGKPGSVARLRIEREDGSRFEVALRREIEAITPNLSARILPSGNLYIRFDVFWAPAAHDFKEALSKFPDAPGVIIDLRNNPGGASDQLFPIAGNFFRGKTELATARTRKRGDSPAFANAGSNPPVYSGPVVVLVGERSGSSSELFAAGLQGTGRARVVGERTCGCVIGASQFFPLKGGGRVMIGQVEWFSPQGRKLEGEGVIPDKFVALTLADIRKNHDTALEEAERLLKELPAQDKMAGAAGNSRQ